MKSKMRNMLVLTVILAMFASVFTGCGKENVQEEKNADKQSEKTVEKTEVANESSEEEVLEFYHGYFHDESEWPAAKAMRDIYDEFAKQHEGEGVVFKPIAVENRDDIVSAQVAGGSYPDIVDVGGGGVPYAALSQNLVLDLKPYIDENGLKDAVGINYTQHDMDGHIYAVHDQIESRGLWYNSQVFEKAGVSEDVIKDYKKLEEAIPKIQAVGDGTYAYIAGQGSCNIIESILASTESGRAMINSELSEEIINSDEFANAFKTVAKMDQLNGSEHTTNNNGNLMAEFNTNGKVGVLFNGVWNASGIDESLEKVIKPALFPNDVAIASAGGGISIANGMSEEKTKLALEFVKYMTSKEVQEKIFNQVQANPCNTTLDLNALAKESGNPITMKLAEACSQVNSAKIVVVDTNYTWGPDVNAAIINALMESAVSGADIDARFEALKKELIALIG